ncbi:Six-hairpin glycosidase [Delitschia confertaspora ATCC 74209]|uniref:Six-hairpin glycosidase n=1 Tax=Delitschia confertaspora ATCC 74209 TaxID=1513339 RepID=A0A9P4JKU5_9PLEO|nr:Six-hairpin glycosidase [Delitschia confertaspora ATCC 74209]
MATISRVASSSMRSFCVLALVACLVVLVYARKEPEAPHPIPDYPAKFEYLNQHVLHPDASKLALGPPSSSDQASAQTPINPLSELRSALSTLQTQYFTIWLGKWPSSIDWTAAVINTHLSAALHTLSSSVSYFIPEAFGTTKTMVDEALMVENEINKYFSQSVTYYFGEDHFAIRNEAYDDMLWVVLGWLESINLINEHNRAHYPYSTPPSSFLKQSGEKEGWWARQFIPGFAHRARVFYDLASKGWDWKLCGGGMNWNPHTRLPYKNAITNELFIASSMGMYLGFPGDQNCEPFVADEGKRAARPAARTEQELDEEQERREKEEKERSAKTTAENTCSEDFPTEGRSTYDPKYLQAAVNGYQWLKSSGMTNSQGLYVDGFHIKDYGKGDNGIGTGKCDDRNEMVYTYNQGVLLSGLRGLWEGTGNVSYLEDGHELIRNVIGATGWNDTSVPTKVTLAKEEDSERSADSTISYGGEWSGLGQAGILAELCDPSGSCSQNGQTFKSIFFHHLTSFCAPLPRRAVHHGKTFAADKALAMLHRRSCNQYAKWVVHNAAAALKSRDSNGRFGMWWGAGEFEKELEARGLDDEEMEEEIKEAFGDVLPEGARDYRNGKPYEFGKTEDVFECGTMRLRPTLAEQRRAQKAQERGGKKTRRVKGRDLNDRGRGRTVETQAGGVSVVRAMWEFVRHLEEEEGEGGGGVNLEL